ncbi:MAG TPA: NAD(P)-dependent oxidoreductase [Thermomicrobiaceae bacterium]|nr:NAD(P)-dependent oxidoreductase [Thermomicrobiaceae bacterium]
MKTIGFVGVGSIGLPMAKRLLGAGYPLVFASSRERACEELEALGGRAVPTPPLVAEACEVFMTALPSDRALSEVYLGPGSVLEHLRPGSIVVDFSTASPMTLQRVDTEARGRDIRVIDAPVSGGIAGAEQGTLTIMAGGEPDVVEEILPIFETLGERVFIVGDVGMGKVFKIINNLLTGATYVLVGEALSLAACAGADLDLLHEVIAVSSGASRAWGDAVPKLVHRADAEPASFRLELMRKDLRLAAGLGEDLATPTPLTSLALQFYTAAVSRGLGRQDAYTVARLVADLARANLTATAEEPGAPEHGSDLAAGDE